MLQGTQSDLTGSHALLGACLFLAADVATACAAAVTSSREDDLACCRVYRDMTFTASYALLGACLCLAAEVATACAAAATSSLDSNLACCRAQRVNLLRVICIVVCIPVPGHTE